MAVVETKLIETPILIAGGGPVGLALALELGWRGVPCTLIEQGDGRIVTPKMNEVNTRTMEFCRRWGIADKVMNCPFPDDQPMDVAYVTRLGLHELARLPRPSRRDNRPGPLSPMNLQACSQFWFDPMLRERAQSFSGVRLLYRHRLQSFREGEGGVLARVADLERGETVAFRARWMVGCDGAGSAVRRALGVPLIGSEALSLSMHLYFRTPNLLERLGVRPGTFFPVIDAGGYWGNVRAIDPKNGLWRLLFDVPEDMKPGFDPDKVDCDAWLRRALARPIEVEWVGASLWTRRGVVAERYSEGPVFMAGDSVHQVSPTGALGMNTGIADAVDLGWKIAAVHAGWGGARLLASYDAERRPAGARNVRMATQFYEGTASFREGLQHIDEDSPRGAQARERAGADLMKGAAQMFRTTGLQLGYQYEGSPVCVPDGTPPPADDPENYHPTARPGSRAPHVTLADERSTLDLFGRNFVLLRLGDAAPSAEALQSAAAARKMPLDIVTLREPEALRAYERRLVLVRPDGHVAWRGDAAPANATEIIDRVSGAI
jgi:2-polyprenyl-6-methoxyphenol hydroxylase-like FAD-dependent oxidoreductase